MKLEEAGAFMQPLNELRATVEARRNSITLVDMYGDRGVIGYSEALNSVLGDIVEAQEKLEKILLERVGGK